MTRYGSKKYGSKKYGSKRRYNSKTNVSTYKKIKNLDKKVKKIQNDTELKFNNGAIHAAVTSDEADILIYNLLAQGTTAKTRVGNEVRLTSISFRGMFYNNKLCLGPSQMRCILFWDRQANGANPNIATSTNGLLYPVEGVEPISYPINYDQSERYTVIFDKLWDFNPQVVQETDETGVTTGTIPVGRKFKYYQKLGRKTKYMGSDATIGSLATNSLCMVFIAQDYDDPMPVLTNDHYVDFDWQIFYKDD